LSSTDELPVPADATADGAADPRLGLLTELQDALGDALVDALHKPGDDLWIRVRTDAWVLAGETAKSLGFDYFCFLSMMDWLPSPYGKGEDDPTEPPPVRETEVRPGYCGGDTRFQLLARLSSSTRHLGFTIKADVPDVAEGEAPEMPSWVGLYAGANWHEREAWEMFGIRFLGHPDLRHLYLPSDFEGYPLRKDFPLLARMVKPWPGIVDVEPMPAELDPESEGAAAPVAGGGAAPAEGEAAAEVEAAASEESPGG
jgi:NADH-quinone oxidoreductase subunit C